MAFTPTHLFFLSFKFEEHLTLFVFHISAVYSNDGVTMDLPDLISESFL